MGRRNTQIVVILILLVGLACNRPQPVTAQKAEQGENPPVLLRLKGATFDPLVDAPAIPENLHLDAYPADGEGAYIVQFQGLIQEEWVEQIKALGGREMGYLPDYAFLVWMDGSTRAKLESLNAVRWVGIYQPAYKLSPDLDRTRLLYRVILFEGSDLAAVESRLKNLNTPTTSVPNEQFTLILPDGNVEAVAAWPEVLWIENHPLYRPTNDVATGIMAAPTAWSSGLAGSGMTVTVADTGIDSGVDTSTPGDMHPDFDNRLRKRISSTWPVPDDGCGGCCIANIGANDGSSDVDSGHGTHVLGSLGGNGTASSGQIKGPAYQATLSFQALEQYVDWTPLCESPDWPDGYYLIGLPNDLGSLFEEAYTNWSSRVHSNSWGSAVAGEYTSDSQAVDQFVWEHPDMIILFAAGNAGTDADWNGYVDEDSLDAPGTAKNCITVGASDNERSSGGYNPGGLCYTWYGCWPYDFPVKPTKTDRLSDSREELAAFSSRGPTDDGRIKPDLVAPGTNILSTLSSRATNAYWYWWGPYDDYYMYMGGTSMSTPLVAGAATLVREYYIEERGYASPSAALVKATLINTAVDITGYGNPNQEAGKPIPNNHEGWGRVNVGAATSGRREFHDWDSVTTGLFTTYNYQVGVSAVPLKVTLAWSDYPANLPALVGLVNDLNLEVIAPDGTTVYRGNNLSGGWSFPGGSADNRNNVESVYINNPAVGWWTIRVRGFNVPQGPQSFALVLTGWFGSPPVIDNWFYLPVVARN
jgi:serine protease AprX